MSAAAFNGQSGQLPFGKAVFQTARLVAFPARGGDGLDRQDTIGAAAIGDDLPLTGKFGEARLERLDR